MPIRPSIRAINATLALRTWTRRQTEATGRVPTPAAITHRAKLYDLKGADLDYAIEFAIPVKATPSVSDFTSS